MANYSIQGTWYNELGSSLIISQVDSIGSFNGMYHTAVDSQEPGEDIPPTPLLGKISTNGENDTFGMTVVWRKGGSVTSWSGQFHICNGEETLMTTWILASKVDTCKENWKAYRIGQDIFKRYPYCHEDSHTMREVAGQK